MSVVHVEMRLRFTADDREDAIELVEMIEKYHDYRALADVLFECDSALINGNPIVPFGG